MTYKYLILLVFIFSLWGMTSQAISSPPTLILYDKTKALPIADEFEVLEDKEDEWSLEDVIHEKNQSNWHYIETSQQDIGMTRSSYWLRGIIKNTSQKTDWYLIQWGSLSRITELYITPVEKNTNWTKIDALKNARYIQHYLHLPRQSEYIVYIKMKDNQAPFVLIAYLIPANVELAWIMDEYPFMSFIIGGLLILVIYNFFYYFQLRDQEIITLSIAILAFTLEMGNHVGMLHAFPWLREMMAGLGSPFGFIVTTAAIILFRSWFDSPSHLPAIDVWMRGFFWLSIVLTLVSPLLIYSSIILGIWSVFLMFFSSMCVLMLHWKGQRLPLSILLALGICMASIMPALLRSIGLVDNQEGVAEVSLIGLLLSLIVFSHAQIEQIRQKRNQAEQVHAESKLKETFLASISHELRSPLTSVVNAGQLLQQTSLSGFQPEYVTRLNIASQHMLALIDNILDLARLENKMFLVNNTNFHLKTVLKQVEQLLQSQTHNSAVQLVFENRCESLKEPLYGDSLRLLQVILNLVGNAIKFTHQGEVRVTISVCQLTQQHMHLLFEVQDTGIGLSQEQQSHLFKVFSQADKSTSRKYGGTGLGLAISYQLVQQMGGELKVDSQLGKGSRFFFVLPFLMQREHHTLSTDNVRRHTPPLNHWLNKHVLLLDDNELNRFFAGKLLESLGLIPMIVDSSQAGFDCILNQTFDLILIDINMPDAHTLPSKIRQYENGRHVPIIGMTTDTEFKIHRAHTIADIDDYLAKPFEIESLQKLLTRWIAIDDAPENIAALKHP